MTESDIRLPDNSWFDGQVASWEGNRFGYRALFEAIVDPSTFREICTSAGNYELIELFEPQEDDVLRLTLLDQDDAPNSETIVLTASNPATIFGGGSRFIIDATASSEPFAYTCTLYGEKPLRLESFRLGDKDLTVTYIESLFIKDGVECDVYKFDDDDTRDLGIVKVAKGSSTPLQRVLSGDLTVEGHLSGDGVLVVARANGNKEHYSFTDGKPARPIEVNRGDTMQWTAREDLVFYEVCEPPYQDGRFLDVN
jgi:hypothetical protein